MIVALVLTLGCATAAAAQGMAGSAQSGDPQVNAIKVQLGIAKNYVTKSADKLSEELYAYAPTTEVRSAGKILAHIADANYMMCSMAKGEKSPYEMFALEKGKTTKADIQKAVGDSYAYCEQALEGLTAASAAEKVDLFGMPQTKLSVVAFAAAHGFEHYGNLVTYMRLKNIVPPSSEPRKPAASQGSGM
jgi:uncharacterized damage-inducible protein DinB